MKKCVVIEIFHRRVDFNWGEENVKTRNITIVMMRSNLIAARKMGIDFFIFLIHNLKIKQLKMNKPTHA